MKKLLLTIFVITLAGYAVSSAQQPSEPQEAPPQKVVQPAVPINEDPINEDPAVQRTIRQVKMLDDIYKGGIVLITENYVNGDEDLPAGTAFKKLFEAAKKKGWHEVRLVDATGEPYSDENVAISDFEKRAIKELKAGKAFVDETVTEQDQRYLLAATPIPVVMEKCTMCHSNYDFDDKGVVIGALTYRIPIDE